MGVAYLTQRPGTTSGDWVSQIGAFLLAKTPEPEFLAAAKNPDPKKEREQLCEAWYFAGMKRLLAGDHTGAAEAFHRCVATEVKDFNEYRLAAAELKALAP